MNIRIYQIDMDKDVERVQFKNLENTLNIAGQVNPAIYSQVYANVCDCNNLEDVLVSRDILFLYLILQKYQMKKTRELTSVILLDLRKQILIHQLYVRQQPTTQSKALKWGLAKALLESK